MPVECAERLWALPVFLAAAVLVAACSGRGDGAPGGDSASGEGGAAGGDSGVGGGARGDEEALEFLRAAGESTAGRAARGAVTVEARSENPVTVFGEDGTVTERRIKESAAVFEFQSDGDGGLSMEIEVDLDVSGVDVSGVDVSGVDVSGGAAEASGAEEYAWEGYDGYYGRAIGADGIGSFWFRRGVELRSADGRAYVGFPADLADSVAEADLSGSGPTVWATAGETVGIVGLCHPLIGASSEGEPCDPQTGVRDLVRLAETASIGGEASVNGAQAVRVSFQVPVGAAGSGLLGEEFDALFPEGAGSAGDGARDPEDSDLFTVEVWIDGEGLVRRMAVDLAQIVMRSEIMSELMESLPEQERPSLELSTVTDFHEFDDGLPAIEAPSSDLVVGHLGSLSDELHLGAGALRADFSDFSDSDIANSMIIGRAAAADGIAAAGAAPGAVVHDLAYTDFARLRTHWDQQPIVVEPGGDGPGGDAVADCSGVLAAPAPAGAGALRNDADALAFLRAAGEALAARPAKGTITVESCTDHDGYADRSSSVVEFESDGSGGISVTVEEGPSGECDEYQLCLWPTAEVVGSLIPREGTRQEAPKDPDIKLPSGALVENRFVGGRGYKGFPSALITRPELRPPGDVAWVPTVRPIGLCAPLKVVVYRDGSCDPQAGVLELTRLARAAAFGGAGDAGGLAGDAGGLAGTTHVLFQVALSDIARAIYGDEAYEAAALRMAEESRGSGRPSALEIVFDAEVWIDGEGQVRRLAVDETPMARALAFLGARVVLERFMSMGDTSPYDSSEASAILESQLAAVPLPVYRSITDFSDFDESVAAVEAPPAESIVENPESLSTPE